MKIIESAKKIQPYLQEIRRELHKHPEISNEEKKTAEIIAEELRKMGISDIKENVNGHGIIAEIHGAGDGKIVALRADMDALQIKEETGLPYKSESEGLMHACGHDAHMTMVLGAARLLNEKKMNLKEMSV